MDENNLLVWMHKRLHGSLQMKFSWFRSTIRTDNDKLQDSRAFIQFERRKTPSKTQVVLVAWMQLYKNKRHESKYLQLVVMLTSVLFVLFFKIFYFEVQRSYITYYRFFAGFDLGNNSWPIDGLQSWLWNYMKNCKRGEEFSFKKFPFNELLVVDKTATRLIPINLWTNSLDMQISL